MLYDRLKPYTSLTKIFETRQHAISALEYGPYDNGHILVGLTNGLFMAFDSINLTKLCQIKVSNAPISSISFEPTQMVIVGSGKS